MAGLAVAALLLLARLLLLCLMLMSLLLLLRPRLLCAIAAVLAPAAPVARRNRHPDQLLDVAQVGALLGVAERDRDAAGAGARGAADAVHVAFGNVRQVVVDDVADAVDVDAARGDVGRHQRAQVSGAERAQHALALV